MTTPSLGARLHGLLQAVADRGAPGTGAAELRELLATADPALLPAAERQSRQRSEWTDPWAQATPRDLARLVRRAESGGDAADGVVLAAALSRNGYVRERAVELLVEGAGPPDGAAIRVMLLRAADWVPEVRAASRRGLVRLAAAMAADPLVAALPLLLRARGVGPSSEGPVQDLIDRLTGPDRGALLHGLTSDIQSVRRASGGLALEADPRSAATAILADVADPVLRRWAAEAVLRERGQVPLELLSDRSSAVRALALSHLIESGDVDEDLVVVALADPARRVREMAQAKARRGGLDVPDWYRQRLTDNPDGVIAISGLAETGGIVDADLLAPLLVHPRPTVRAVAATGLGRVLRGPALDVLIPLLRDGSPRVRRSAARALVDGDRAPPPSLVVELLEDPNAHVSRQAVWLMRFQPRFSQAWLYLAAVEGGDTIRHGMAVQGLSGWARGHARTWVGPLDAANHRRTVEALDRHGHRVPPVLRDELARLLSVVAPTR